MILPVKRRYIEREEVAIVRRLGAPGKIVVRVGDKIASEDHLGTAEVTSGVREIDLGVMFGVNSAEVEKGLLKEVGQPVVRGEGLFKVKKMLGLKSEEYDSPVEGVLSEVRDGVVSIKSNPVEVVLKAGFAGEVEKVYEGEAVEIKATATVVRGVTGVGKLHFGELQVVGRGADMLLPQDLDADSGGKIVVGGALLAADTIEKALAIGVVGFVTGGINFREAVSFSTREKAGLGLLILEGYGLHRFDKELLDKLKDLDGRYGALDGEEGVLYVAREGKGEKVSGQPWRELKSGDTVRVVAGPELGRVGKVVKIGTEDEELRSGIMSKLLKIETQDGEITIPWQNLEILEN